MRAPKARVLPLDDAPSETTCQNNPYIHFVKENQYWQASMNDERFNVGSKYAKGAFGNPQTYAFNTHLNPLPGRLWRTGCVNVIKSLVVAALPTEMITSARRVDRQSRFFLECFIRLFNNKSTNHIKRRFEFKEFTEEFDGIGGDIAGFIHFFKLSDRQVDDFF